MSDMSGMSEMLDMLDMSDMSDIGSAVVLFIDTECAYPSALVFFGVGIFYSSGLCMSTVLDGCPR